MKLRIFAAIAAAALLAACGGDSSTAAPTANPTPTPTPIPTPTPTPALGNAFTQLTASTLGYVRDGASASGRPAAYHENDVIFLDCTPRDVFGVATKNHPLTGIQWIGSQVPFTEHIDYDWNAADTFDPDLRLKSTVAGRSGNIVVNCILAGIESNDFVVNVASK